MSPNQTFQSNGYLVVSGIVSETGILNIENHLASVSLSGVGTRNLLGTEWCSKLASELMRFSTIKAILPNETIPIQCTYFHKSESKNWLVALHRDLSIPVKARIDSHEWRGWSEKEGMLFAQPPKAVLQSTVAVRLHLEDNTELNSPLQVVPGSHAHLTSNAVRTTCLVPRGGALVMSPLILHSSSKLQTGSRRVLHFVFGPRHLPNEAQWAHATIDQPI